MRTADAVVRRVDIREGRRLLVSLSGADEPAAELVLRRAGAAELRAALVAGADHKAEIELADLAAAGPGSWTVAVAPGDAPVRVPEAVALGRRAVATGAHGLQELRLRRTEAGTLSVAVAALAAHAELERARVERSALVLAGRLPGPETGARLVARRRMGEVEVGAEAELEEGRWAARLPFAGLAAARAGRRGLGPGARRPARRRHTWTTCPASRASRLPGLARREPGAAALLHRRGRAVGPLDRRPVRPASAARARGRRIASPAAARRRGRRAAPRRAGRRGAAAPAPRAGARGPAVRVLLLHAFGLGGTVRTSFNLARHFAGGRVEIDQRHPAPRRPVPRACPRRRGARARRPPPGRGAGRRALLARLPSLLVHPDDFAYPHCSLWTDVQLVRRLRAIRGGVLVTTRPAFNLLAARLAAPGVVTIGQEHMNIAAHRPRLAADMRRRYGAARRARRADARPTSATTRGARRPARAVVRIPNAVPRAGRRRAALEPRSSSPPGGCETQKGFDLLIDAWEPVAAATRTGSCGSTARARGARSCGR